MSEKRKYQRAPLSTSVTVTADDGRTWQAYSNDIGVGGMFLHGESPVTIGSALKLQLELPGLGLVEIEAFLRWTTEAGFGLQFRSLGVRETHVIGSLVREASALASNA